MSPQLQFIFVTTTLITEFYGVYLRVWNRGMDQVFGINIGHLLNHKATLQGSFHFFVTCMLPA